MVTHQPTLFEILQLSSRRLDYKIARWGRSHVALDPVCSVTPHFHPLQDLTAISICCQLTDYPGLAVAQTLVIDVARVLSGKQAARTYNASLPFPTRKGTPLFSPGAEGTSTGGRAELQSADQLRDPEAQLEDIERELLSAALHCPEEFGTTAEIQSTARAFLGQVAIIHAASRVEEQPKG